MNNNELIECGLIESDVYRCIKTCHLHTIKHKNPIKFVENETYIVQFGVHAPNYKYVYTDTPYPTHICCVTKMFIKEYFVKENSELIEIDKLFDYYLTLNP